MGSKSQDTMSSSSQADITQLLEAAQGGNAGALNALFPLVYEELHSRAHRQRRGWHGDYTVNTTALVHEAYLKLVNQTHATWKSRAHFFAVAAKAMRHILIDYAERRRTRKRGGDVQKLSLDELKVLPEEVIVMSDERAHALVALDAALKKLADLNERQSRIVECRFFGGMTIPDTAEALGLSPATVKRDWALAQAWLFHEIKQAVEP